MKTFRISLIFASFRLFTLLGAERPTPDEGSRLNEAGLKDIREGRFADGALKFAAEVEIWLSLGNSYGPHVAIALANLGSTQAATGAFDKSIKTFEEALSISSNTFGARDCHAAAIKIDYSRSLMAVDNDEKAGNLLEEAYGIAHSLSPDGPEVARSLRGLAMLAIRKGDAQNAEEYLRRVSGMPDGATPEGEVEGATVEAALARLYSSAWEFDKADALLRRVTAVYERNISPDDPRLILLTAQKGMRYVDEKKYALGERYLERALAKMKNAGVENSPDAATVENSLALARLELGETREADLLLEHVLSVERAFYAKPNRAVAASLLNRALSLGKQHRYREAIECVRSSIDIYEATAGPRHPETGNALLVYSDLLRAGGNRNEAKVARNRAEIIFKQFEKHEPS